ncbi:MAG TPA: cbb3-type cytochrome c oxidase N-terminal domain-containing protein, partial [Cryomorphaceae bacterium]|nr:cbb3-type cytochrome c oxidase N-terminal domain-containing protein [Cryomorphaceae bacterium]
FLYMTQLLKSTVAMLMPEVEEEPEVREVAETSKVMHALTDAVPLDREHEVMMDHEYDGIRELDNNLPPWWVWMFYATIAFGFVYLVYYHVLPYGLTQEEEYLAEVQQAEEAHEAYLAAAKNLVDENNIVMLADVSDLQVGKSIFIEKCQQCHAADGGGGVGPNLTDPYWIHGGSIKDIFKTVKYGVPTKGMISWESQLRPIEMAQVSSYIKTLEGTTPAAPKDPQGELWVAPDETVAPADSTAQDSPNVEEEMSEEDAQTATL